MPRIAYEPNAMGPVNTEIARVAASIAREYAQAGYDLTLRQAYYQFVARGITADWPTGANTERSYKRLGRIIDAGRMCGIIDWSHIVDRTRGISSGAHWTSPSDVIDSAAYGYATDKWIGQPKRVELWVEKEALAGVVGQVANQRDCSYMACRGYMSSSAMWRAAQRLGRIIEGGQDVVILHLGDHDPSGIDMSRDNYDRLAMMIAHDFRTPDALEFRRIALNMDQVRQYNPPPNPAKLTDSRSGSYVAEHGGLSWELDALPPDVLVALMNDHIDREIDQELYDLRYRDQEEDRDGLLVVARNWSEVAEFARDNLGD